VEVYVTDVGVDGGELEGGDRGALSTLYILCNQRDRSGLS
jgi:hypothetical protein